MNIFFYENLLDEIKANYGRFKPGDWILRTFWEVLAVTVGELFVAASVGSEGVSLNVAVSSAAPKSVVGDSVEVVEGSDDIVAGVVVSSSVCDS